MLAAFKTGWVILEAVLGGLTRPDCCIFCILLLFFSHTFPSVPSRAAGVACAAGAGPRQGLSVGAVGAVLEFGTCRWGSCQELCPLPQQFQ